MKNTFILHFVFLISVMGTIAFAQQVDSAGTDSSSASLMPPDSTIDAQALQVAEINLNNAKLDSAWQVVAATNHFPAAQEGRNLFRFEDILFLNYTGLADVFRHRPAYQVFDLFNPGFPRYIAGLHLLPHQTGISYEGSGLNDPMSGMYNTHQLSLDGIQGMYEIDPAGADKGSAYGYDSGVYLTSPLMNYEEAYSRIMFRQGDFGYTDLDISFAQKFGRNAAVYLGGINKTYDSVIRTGGSYNRGFQYRAGLNYRIRPDLYLHTTYNFNRDKLELENYSRFNLYRHLDFRQDIQNSLYYVTNPETGERWRLSIDFNRIRRRNDSKTEPDTFSVTRKADQFNINLDRNFVLDGLELSGAVNAYQNKVWGVGFPGDLTDTGMNGALSATYSLNKNLTLTGKLKSAWLYGHSLNFSPHASFNFNSQLLEWTIRAGLDHRFPARTERSFRYESYSGNADLEDESIAYAATALTFRPLKYLRIITEAGHKSIRNEILFNGTSFYAGQDRSFSYLSLDSEYKFYVFSIGASGQIGHADINLSPEKSASAQIRYRDAWLNGALIIDAIGNFHWYDRHNTLFYHPITERFYWNDSKSEGYNYFSYKIAATVKSAQLYVAMDNPFSKNYQLINGYYELYRRVRFGVNWVLWN